MGLKSNENGAHKRKEKEVRELETLERRPCERRGRDCSYVTISQGCQEPSEAGRDKGEVSIRACGLGASRAGPYCSPKKLIQVPPVKQNPMCTPSGHVGM